MTPERLERQVVQNHYFAKAYPVAVKKFLRDEVEKWAMIRPFEELPFPCFHVLLMSRQKDTNDQQIICTSFLW